MKAVIIRVDGTLEEVILNDNMGISNWLLKVTTSSVNVFSMYRLEKLDNKYRQLILYANDVDYVAASPINEKATTLKLLGFSGPYYSKGADGAKIHGDCLIINYRKTLKKVKEIHGDVTVADLVNIVDEYKKVSPFTSFSSLPWTSTGELESTS